MSKFLSFWKNNRFGVVSWLVTVALVASLLGGAFWWRTARADASALVPQPTAGPGADAPSVNLPLPPISGAVPSVGRRIQLVTNIPAELPRYDPIQYTVERGDAMSKIAEKFDIDSESILYNNKDVLNDDPHGLKPGMVLVIPPVDGMLYTWKEGDTLEKVAGEFKAKAEDIINFPGNDVDLTNPDFKSGTQVMIPGGSRDLINWSQFVPTITRGSGTGTSETGGNSCGGGSVGDGVFGWPTGGPHTISGNNYSAGHLGIDITANEGDPIYAADAGVVTMAGWSQYGYGNVVQIDHGNGFVSLYAHLSTYNVSVCMSVGQGTVIGGAGNTGNSFGAHLHFEIRIGGANVNPLDFLP
jgi:murein DD-endopeptidase MepM/ murein hydrolase activator NlpD